MTMDASSATDIRGASWSAHDKSQGKMRTQKNNDTARNETTNKTTNRTVGSLAYPGSFYEGTAWKSLPNTRYLWGEWSQHIQKKNRQVCGFALLKRALPGSAERWKTLP